MKKQACSSCLKQCERLHGPGEGVKCTIPSLSPSFLKKIGPDNTEMLHIPSSFVKSHSNRLGTSLTIEGPSTNKWTVSVEGSFAKCAINMGLGWKSFVKDHHLQPGDQLLFTLTGDSYFSVEVYDESGCQKLGALDATNPLKPEGDSTGTTQEANTTFQECQDHEADKSCSKGSTPAASKGSTPARPLAQKRKENHDLVKEAPSTKKALISLSSDESDREGKGEGKGEVNRQEKPRTATKRGRLTKSQNFYQDDDEDDFSLFHKPRARNTPMRSAAVDAEKKAKKKPETKREVVPPPPLAALLSEKVGHGMCRSRFVIDGSLEYPLPVEAK